MDSKPLKYDKYAPEEANQPASCRLWAAASAAVELLVLGVWRILSGVRGLQLLPEGRIRLGAADSISAGGSRRTGSLFSKLTLDKCPGPKVEHSKKFL